MAEYLPVRSPGQALTLTASATITAGQLLIVSGSGTVAPSSAASQSWLGVAGNDAASAEIDALGARQRRLVRPDAARELRACDRESARRRQGRLHRPDQAVFEDHGSQVTPTLT